MAEIKMKLKTPMVPNFIFFEAPPVRRQDGFSEAPKVSISELSDETLDEIAKDWKNKLFQRAYELKKERAKDEKATT